MYYNIVFDLGGVVVNFDPHNWLMKHFLNAKTEQTVYRLTFGSPDWQLLDTGALGENTFRQRALERAEKANCVFEVETVLDDWQSMLTTRAHTVSLMKHLKRQGVRLYYLSNTERSTLELLRRRSFWSLWDGGVGSCEIGICKPDPRIYDFLVTRYELDPGATLFIDDNPANVLAAEQFGLAAHCYRTERGLENALAAHGLPVRHLLQAPQLHHRKRERKKQSR